MTISVEAWNRGLVRPGASARNESNTMATIDRITVSAPNVWHDDYRVTVVTRHRTGAGVWDGAGDTPREALTAAALSAGIPAPDEIPHDDYTHPRFDPLGSMCPICDPTDYTADMHDSYAVPAPTRVLPSGDTVRAYRAGEWS